MTPVHPTQAQIDQVLADARIGRAFREAAEGAAYHLAHQAIEEGDYPGTMSLGEHVEHRMDWEGAIMEADAWGLLGAIVKRAADECDDGHGDLAAELRADQAQDLRGRL